MVLLQNDTLKTTVSGKESLKKLLANPFFCPPLPRFLSICEAPPSLGIEMSNSRSLCVLLTELWQNYSNESSPWQAEALITNETAPSL